MKQCFIVCDVSLCHDCNNCFIACKDEHVDNDWPPYTGAQPRHGHRWTNILRTERGQYPRIDVAYLPMPCQHCADAPCIKANPGCISRRDDGIVLIDPVKAKGDKALADSCPFGAIYWNEDAGVAQKCTMCAHILDGEGGCGGLDLPRCVHSCPTGALEFFRLEPEDMELKIKNESLERYNPGFSGGGAGVWYKNLYRFEKLFIAGGLLKDFECAEGEEVTLVSACDGKTCSQLTDCFGDFKFDRLSPGEYTIRINGAGEKTVAISESLNLGSIAIKHN